MRPSDDARKCRLRALWIGGRRALAYAVPLLLAPALAGAANLDVSASYKLRGVSVSNMDLGQDPSGRIKHSFLSDDARLGVAVRKIRLPGKQGGGEEATMDLGLVLHAIGVSGSTTSVASPFSRAALYYPRTDSAPFIENAYMRVRGLWGLPLEYTLGRQSFRLGSGLLLDDDGAGLTGFSMRGELPWWSMKAEGFVFADKNPLNTSAPNPVTYFGGSVDLPGEGTWQLLQLFEKDGSSQLVYGCNYPGNPELNGCRVSKAFRSFTSARYQISYGPLVFDGEAAIQKGVATPTGAMPASHHITYNGNAQVVRMKWKQRLYRSGEGIMRVSVARGTGDDVNTQTRDEAFFPSHGHRHSGLERSGFGEFFAATPYDAYGGNYSSSTASGLAQGFSGVLVAGAGYTPPAFHGFNLDVDYFLYQAERVSGASSRTLGMEWDVRLRYPLMDQLQLSASMAYFKAGKAIDNARRVSRKYVLEVSGRF